MTHAAYPQPASDRAPDASRLADFLGRSRRLVVLTGAGCSTESGIPDYRDRDGEWKHSKPMSFRDFTDSRSARRRYWARSAAGWGHIEEARPNPGHRALARLEEAGRLDLLITQNVDGLHQRAGSRRVVDLHGRLDRVECLDCRTGYRRGPFQQALRRENPDWRHWDPSSLRSDAAGPRPDGDVDLGGVDYDAFRLPTCPRCGGDVKPSVVFFGEPVPRRRTDRAFAALAEADALLVVGSSLMVWSGYRFAKEAHRRGLPLALVNLGQTRADAEATLKVEASCGEVLPAALAELDLA